MDKPKKILTILQNLGYTAFGGFILGITMTFFTAMWEGISSFRTEMKNAQLENEIRAAAIEKVFVDKISEVKVEINSLKQIVKNIDIGPPVPAAEEWSETFPDLVVPLQNAQRFDVIQKSLESEIEGEYRTRKK